MIQEKLFITYYEYLLNSHTKRIYIIMQVHKYFLTFCKHFIFFFVFFICFLTPFNMYMYIASLPDFWFEISVVFSRRLFKTGSFFYLVYLFEIFASLGHWNIHEFLQTLCIQKVYLDKVGRPPTFN